jgi:hypothetical protein
VQRGRTDSRINATMLAVVDSTLGIPIGKKPAPLRSKFYRTSRARAAEPGGGPPRLQIATGAQASLTKRPGRRGARQHFGAVEVSPRRGLDSVSETHAMCASQLQPVARRRVQAHSAESRSPPVILFQPWITPRQRRGVGSFPLRGTDPLTAERSDGHRLTQDLRGHRPVEGVSIDELDSLANFRRKPINQARKL